MKRALGMAPPLIQDGHDVTICMEDAAENRAALNEIAGCRALFYQKGSWWQERKAKRRQLRSAKFDFIHFCGLGWRNALLPGIELKSPAIMEHTELESSLVNTAILRRTAQWILEFGSVLWYSNTVASSKYLERLFRRRTERLGLKRNILYLPFASDESIADIGETRAREIRHELGSARLVMYTGNLYPAYGVLDLLDALVELRKSRTDWICVYTGEGPSRAELERRTEMAGMANVIRFLGRVPEEEMAAYMKNAAVFVSPLRDTVTDWARCPSKTFMYLMFEKPIVTCRVGENLNSLGEDGFYYTPGDSRSMRQAIDRALNVSSEWRPGYRKADHTWQARASAYQRWLMAIQGS
jgi:glycosyltransferase involved in cell wall biosynthesis